MRTYLFVIALSLLIVGNIASNACSAPLDLRPRMTSGSFNIDYKNNPAKNTSVVDYAYPYKQTFNNAPSTAVGITGFDFDPSRVMGFQVTVSKQTGHQVNFKVGVNSNENWKKINVNFFSTNRPDFQVGDVHLSEKVTSDNFKLSYNFKNNWSSVDLLKLKIFISSFSLSTNQQTTMRLNLQRIDFQQKGLNLLYSTRSPGTVLNSFSVNMIIFDGLSPALRFSEGVISQNYLTSKITLQVPQKGLQQVRNFIVGITSFDVQTNAPISAFSNLNNKFLIEFGPNSEKCVINLLTVSYIVVSVNNDCGNCPPNFINLNGRCVRDCPEGYYSNNGQCYRKTCYPGSYLSGNQCIQCPRHSNIKQCNNSCPQGTVLKGEDCILICPNEYQTYSYGKCVCTEGYYRINGACSRCPKGQKYDYCHSTCVSICPPNSVFVESTQTCKCNEGYYLFHGKCIQCAPGEIFYPNWGVCYPACGQNAQFNGKQCVCSFGYNLVDNRCIVCRQGTTYDPQYRVCKENCGQNEVWQTFRCVCAQYYYRINGYCQSCPTNTFYDPVTQTCREQCTNGQIWLMGKCQCSPGSYFINGRCGICDQWARYDETTKRCELICKQEYTEYYAGICRCVRGFQKEIERCVPKKCPDNSVYQPISDTCVCLPGYYLSRQTGQCQEIKKCPPNSKFIYGQCVCNEGYVFNIDRTACISCNAAEFQVFTGMQCVCREGYTRNSYGKCAPIVIPPTCKENQYYDPKHKCCFCNPGFDRVFGKCIKIPKCDENSYWNGKNCACKTGFVVGPSGKCEPIRPPNCDQNSRWDGKACVCKPGFTVGPSGRCQPYNPPAPDCGPNAFWDGHKCVCKPGYTVGRSGKCEYYLPPDPTCGPYSKWDGKKCVCVAGYVVGPSGKCQPYIPPTPDCGPNAFWDGQKCQCRPGYVVVSSGRCQPYTPPPPPPPVPEKPKCPYNSRFNGVKCVCIERFFQYSPGVCATCPPNMTWNGRKCAYDKACWAGFKWDDKTECCVPIDVECPQNSKWNGQSCECAAGYNAVGKQCIKCEYGYQFDGAQCVRVQESVQCLQVNTIVAGGVCVCRPGTHEYEGQCIQCLYPTVWNGEFCQGNNDGCFAVPYSQINPVNRKCECIRGFRPVHGTCVPFFGFINGQYSYPYASWTFETASQWERWNEQAYYFKNQPKVKPKDYFYGDKFTQKWNSRFYNQNQQKVLISSQYYGNVVNQLYDQDYYTVIPNTFGFNFGWGDDNNYGSWGWDHKKGGWDDKNGGWGDDKKEWDHKKGGWDDKKGGWGDDKKGGWDDDKKGGWGWDDKKGGLIAFQSHGINYKH